MHFLAREMLAQTLRRNVSGSLLYNFWRILRGISWRIFLGTFSHKNEEKSAKKSGGPKKKNRKKSVLPKTNPKK